MAGVAVPKERTTLSLVIAANAAAKVGLVALLLLAVVNPAWGNMEDKAAELRAATYPLLAFAVPPCGPGAGVAGHPSPGSPTSSSR